MFVLLDRVCVARSSLFLVVSLLSSCLVLVSSSIEAVPLHRVAQQILL